MKKMWCIFACVCLLYGCGKAENSLDSKMAASDEELPLCEQHSEDKVTLEWYVNYSWFTVPWGENVVSRQITEDTGISIRFLAPKGNEKERINSLISSDSLPDIVTLGWWEPQLNEMIDKGMVYPLNELATGYDTSFFEVSQEAVRSWYTSEDGNLYCYPNSSFMPSDYETYDTIGSNQTFLVRKDIYEAIGSPDMTTPEGFQAAVRRAVQEFPVVDGGELIPIGAHEFTDTGCASFDQYLQNFLAIPFEKDGKYYDRDTDPEYIRWLKAFRELGAEGYLKGDIFIDQRTQMEEKMAQGRYFCMLYQRTDMADQQKLLYNRDPESAYIAVDGPKNSKGDDPVLPGAGINGWTVTLISRNCERPDRAIELIDYMMSEKGQKMMYFGVEGVTYDVIDGKCVVREEVKALADTDRVAYDQLYGADNTYWMLQNIAMQLPWRGKPEPPLGQLEEWTYPYTHYLGQYELTYQTSTEAGNSYAKIKKLWSQVLPQLLLAPTEEEFDRILADFAAKREEMGFGAVTKEAERQFQSAKESLGL